MKHPSFFSILLSAALLATGLLGQARSEPLPAAAVPLPEHPQGEWYQVGREMAKESQLAYRPFKSSLGAIESDLVTIMHLLNVNPNSLKTTEYEMLKKGWHDALHQQPAAYAIPADQTASQVPKSLRGFHKFKKAPRGSDKLTSDDIESVQRGVVMISTPTGGGGTGFFVTPELVLTNKHVVKSHKTLSVTNDFSTHTVEGTVLEVSQNRDLAIVLVPDAASLGREVLPVADSSEVRVGDEIAVIGYPQFSENLVTTFGRISSKKVVAVYGRTFQLSGAEANPGNSGGPLVNNKGEVVGVLTFLIRELQGYNFCVESSEAIPLLSKYCPETIEHIR